MSDSVNTTSAFNTPQAVDDFYTWLEQNIQANYIQSLDVMANDLGGKAKTLYSIDNGDELTDLFQQDAQVTFESSALGAQIHILNGQIIYDATALAALIDALGEGETLTDTLTYSIRLGNGTLSLGQVTLTITGTNDAAVITGDIDGSVAEDSAPNPISGDLTSTDVDGVNDSFVATAAPAASALGYGTYSVDATGQWSYVLDNGNAAVNALATGQTLTDSFTVATTDGTVKTVTILIQGQTDGIALPAVYDGADPSDHDDLIGTPANIEGNDFSQTIVGTSGADTINAYAGDDTVDANHGADFVYGGAGNDHIEGNVGLDTLLGQAGEDELLGEENADAIYGGSGSDIIDGGLGGDALYGGSGNDTINGSGAADIIIGGFGADVLTGGNLDDTFRYLDLRDTGDRIVDFVGGQDIVDFEAIDANSTLAGNQAFLFGGTTATAHGLWYSQEAGGGVRVYLDTDGDIGTAELTLLVDTVTSLQALDFFL